MAEVIRRMSAEIEIPAPFKLALARELLRSQSSKSTARIRGVNHG
jgi:hypothetical protein